MALRNITVKIKRAKSFILCCFKNTTTSININSIIFAIVIMPPHCHWSNCKFCYACKYSCYYSNNPIVYNLKRNKRNHLLIDVVLNWKYFVLGLKFLEQIFFYDVNLIWVTKFHDDWWPFWCNWLNWIKIESNKVTK